MEANQDAQSMNTRILKSSIKTMEEHLVTTSSFKFGQVGMVVAEQGGEVSTGLAKPRASGTNFTGEMYESQNQHPRR